MLSRTVCSEPSGCRHEHGAGAAFQHVVDVVGGDLLVGLHRFGPLPRASHRAAGRDGAGSASPGPWTATHGRGGPHTPGLAGERSTGESAVQGSRFCSAHPSTVGDCWGRCDAPRQVGAEGPARTGDPRRQVVITEHDELQ